MSKYRNALSLSEISASSTLGKRILPQSSLLSSHSEIRLRTTNAETIEYLNQAMCSKLEVEISLEQWVDDNDPTRPLMIKKNCGRALVNVLDRSTNSRFVDFSLSIIEDRTKL